ncbi:MAG: propionyl-CoA synthetase, partial [Proteobacteria bacterium]|nr:propionyl-CoA synthetase [Pseudomonadota bacterium]
MASQYQAIYDNWKNDPEGFWGKLAEKIDWIKAPDANFDPKMGVSGRWFPGGETNTCYNAVDRHVAAGNGDRVALIYDSPVTNSKRKITYAELQDEVETLAAALAHRG